MQLSARFLCLVLAIAIWPAPAQNAKFKSHLCVAERDRGCIQGSVGDEFGTPLKGIEVEILPADKAGDARWEQKQSGWTDSYGNYYAGRIMPGDYLVAVHYYGAPDARKPFPTTFYPGVEEEGRAERVSVREGFPALLKQ